MSVAKKIGCVAAGVILLAAAFLSGHYAGAASKTPGSAEDPLITLSYLESRLTGQGGYTAVSLKKGEVLTGSTGTAIILLRGSATAAGKPVVDLTGGSLTAEDTSLFLYHSYIVPEEKGGCKALSACTLLIAGEYQVR